MHPLERQTTAAMITAARADPTLWDIRKDDLGRPVALCVYGWDIIHLEVTSRTEESLPLLLSYLRNEHN